MYYNKNTDSGMNNTQNKNKKKTKFTTPKRTAWYIFRTALILAIIVTVLSLAFFFAMDASNIYIIVTEGMTLRIDCTLGGSDPNEMYEYFLADFVESDDLTHNSDYFLYDIETYDYRLDINGLGLFPFASHANMTVTERVPYIVGEAGPNAPSASVPEWTPARYKVSCTKIDGRWFISDVTLIEENPPEPVRPTPDMSLLTPNPSAPAKTAEPTETPDTTETVSPEPSDSPED